LDGWEDVEMSSSIVAAAQHCLQNVFGINRALLLGPRENIQIQAKTMMGTQSSFPDIGWERELYKSGSSWLFRRFLSNNPATKFHRSLGVRSQGTSSTTRDLNTYLKTMLALRATIDDDYLYILPPSNATMGSHATSRTTDHVYVHE